MTLPTDPSRDRPRIARSVRPARPRGHAEQHQPSAHPPGPRDAAIGADLARTPRTTTQERPALATQARELTSNVRKARLQLAPFLNEARALCEATPPSRKLADLHRELLPLQDVVRAVREGASLEGETGALVRTLGCELLAVARLLRRWDQPSADPELLAARADELLLAGRVDDRIEQLADDGRFGVAATLAAATRRQRPSPDAALADAQLRLLAALQGGWMRKAQRAVRDLHALTGAAPLRELYDWMRSTSPEHRNSSVWQLRSALARTRMPELERWLSCMRVPRFPASSRELMTSGADLQTSQLRRALHAAARDAAQLATQERRILEAFKLPPGRVLDWEWKETQLSSDARRCREAILAARRTFLACPAVRAALTAMAELRGQLLRGSRLDAHDLLAARLGIGIDLRFSLSPRQPEQVVEPALVELAQLTGGHVLTGLTQVRQLSDKVGGQARSRVHSLGVILLRPYLDDAALSRDLFGAAGLMVCAGFPFELSSPLSDFAHDTSYDGFSRAPGPHLLPDGRISAPVEMVNSDPWASLAREGFAMLRSAETMLWGALMHPAHFALTLGMVRQLQRPLVAV